MPRPYAVRLLIVPLLVVSGWTIPLPAASAAPAPAPGPGRAFYVAPNGLDNAAGSSSAPVRSVARAVSLATSGDTIVVQAGTYHEGVVIPDGKPLSIVGKGKVWLDGSTAVTNWRSTSNGFVSDDWTASFDSSPTYTWGAPDNTQPGWAFLNPSRPMAAHPDQVWVNGRAQRQISSLAGLRPGTFYVDERADRLHLGTDPRGKKVRASDIAKAISIRAAGTRISNINVRRFAPSVPHMGAVTAERSGIVLKGMRIRDNATTGLHVMGANTVLRRVRVSRNGMLGMSATGADNLRIFNSAARGNNTEGFNHAPVAGGAKIGRTRNVLVRSSTFNGNAGTGLWLDEAVFGITVVDSLVRNNRHHGISLEISVGALVTDTVIAGNADNGIKVNNTSQVALWNNTLIGNGRSINIVQDDRNPVLGPVQVHNNILSSPNSSANCLLCVEDYSGRFTAEDLDVTASGNVYQRRGRNSPTWAVVWSRADRNPAVFDTVADFRRGTSQESRHLELVGKKAIRSNYRPTRVVRKAVRIAEPIPRALARIVDVASQKRHLGAWID